MSEQQTGRDIDQALMAWMDRTAPQRAPARLIEATFLETMGARQARVYPWHKVNVGSLRRTAGSGGRPALVVVVALLVVALTVVLVGGGGRRTVPPISSPAPTVTPAPSVSASLPAPIAVVPEATIPVQRPIDMVARGTELWVMAPGRLDRIDPDTNAVTASVPLGSTTDLYNGLAANDAAVWATDDSTALLYRVDPATLKVAATIPVGLSPKGVLAAAGGVWVADVHGGTVLRIDEATNTVASTITVGPTGQSGPNWLAYGLGSIWVDVPNNGTIVRFDPATEAQVIIQSPAGFQPCGGFAIGTEAVWVTGCSGSHLMARIDPASNTVVATVDLGGFGFNPTMVNGFPWVSVDTEDAQSGMLVRIDPATTAIDRVLVPSTPFGGGGDIVVAAGSVWVVDGYNNSVIRLPLTAFAP